MMMMKRHFVVALSLLFLILLVVPTAADPRKAVEKFHNLLSSPIPEEKIIQATSSEDAVCYNETFSLSSDLNQYGGLLGVFTTSEIMFCFTGRGDCDFSGTLYETAAIENCAAANGRLITGDLYVCGNEFGDSENDNIRLANLPLCVDAGCPFDTTYQSILRTALDLGLGGSSSESFEGTLRGDCVPPSETMDAGTDIAVQQDLSPQYFRGIRLSVREFANGIANGRFDVILDVRSRPEWNQGHIEGATLANNLGSCCGAGHYGASPYILRGCESCSIAVYGRSGSRASAAIQVLRDNGFQGNLYNAQGTIQWTNAGYSLVTTTDSVVPPCTIYGENFGSCIASPEKLSKTPTRSPTESPTKKPTKTPTTVPTVQPTKIPTDKPTSAPSSEHEKHSGRKVPREQTKSALKFQRSTSINLTTIRGEKRRKLVNAEPDELDR